MFALEWRKVLMHEFHYDCIKNKYDNKSKLLFTDNDSLMYEIKTEDVYEGYSSDKEMFDFSDYSTKSKCSDTSSKLVIKKMNYETGGIVVKEFVGLKSKMCSSLVDNSEHKKAKGTNKIVGATVSHNEYKDVVLNNKSIRDSMNRIQSRDHRIGFYENKRSSMVLFI